MEGGVSLVSRQSPDLVQSPLGSPAGRVRSCHALLDGRVSEVCVSWLVDQETQACEVRQPADLTQQDKWQPGIAQGF